MPPKLAFETPTQFCTYIQISMITGEKPVGYYLRLLSAALLSPFTISPVAEIPPQSTLLKRFPKVTTLNHRFYLLNYVRILSRFKTIVNSFFQKTE